MPFPGERLAPRGNPKSWEVKKDSKVEEFDMRVRVFTNGATERIDVEVIDGKNKRRIFTHDGPHGEVRGEGFIAGYAAGRATLKPLTPQAKSRPGKKKPEITNKKKAPLTLETATHDQLVDALIFAMKDMGNPHWDTGEQKEQALSYVLGARAGKG